MELPQQTTMTPEQAFERLQEWYIEKRKLSELKQAEHLERTSLVRYYFHNPVEGTNRMDLGGGFDLKLVHGYNIKVDEAELDNVKAADIKRLKLPWDDLFVYKPTLAKSVYNGLTAEQKKFVDQLLDIKEASPQLDIVPKANAEGQQAHVQAAEAAAASNDARYIIAPQAEAAEPGHYYCDGETWWRLTEEIEWEEVTDEATIEALHKQHIDHEAAATPSKPARKRATSKRTKAKE